MRRRLARLLIYAALLAGSALFLTPLGWMLTSSLKRPEAIFRGGLLPVETYVRTETGALLRVRVVSTNLELEGPRGERQTVPSHRAAPVRRFPAPWRVAGWSVDAGAPIWRLVGSTSLVEPIETRVELELVPADDPRGVLKRIDKEEVEPVPRPWWRPWAPPLVRHGGREWVIRQAIHVTRTAGERFEVRGEDLVRRLEPQWHNYAEALAAISFPRATANTLLITVLALAGTVLSASLCAYSFARLRWPGRDGWFMVVIATIMLPPQVTMIAQYMIWRRLGAVDTYFPLWVPAWLGGGAFAIFLLRQYFTTIPLELEEAARIDGCPSIRIWWEIVLPLSKPALAAVGVFTFMAVWNDFLNPLIYIVTPEKFTLALALQSFLTIYGAQWHLMMAASMVILCPVLVLFFVAQRHFIQGITLTGMKG